MIATLERHYSPPIPARINGTENPSYLALVADYLTALRPFTDAALESGMRDLVNGWKFTRWPKIGELVAVIRDTRQALPSPSSGTNWRYGYWDAVRERRDSFVSGFMSGTLGQESAAGGWSDQLRQYVSKIAWYQAQITVRCERQGKAFSTREKKKDGSIAYPRDLIEFFLLEDLERHGAITVNIPTEQIESMKRRAQQQAQHGAERDKPSYIPGLPQVEAAE